jgi:hypothetical protein
MSDSKPAFCTNCGAVLAPGTAFCDQCGHRVAAASPSPSPSVSPAPAPVLAPEPAPSAPRSSSALLVALVIIAAVVGVAAAMLWGRLKPSPPAATTPPDAIAVTPDKPATLADPVEAAVNPGRPPVEVAYIHFLDEAHRVTGGKISCGFTHLDTHPHRGPRHHQRQTRDRRRHREIQQRTSGHHSRRPQGCRRFPLLHSRARLRRLGHPVV